MKMLSKIIIPSDISYLIDRLEKVKRFDHPLYPKDVFIDNTKNHTLRLVLFAEKLPLKKEDTNLLARMLFIHDLPEIRYGDVPVIMKNSSDKSLNTVLFEEEKVARQILSGSDYVLFCNFQKAYKYLVKISDKFIEANLDIAIIANLIDRMDGNLFYHKHLTKWINSSKYISNQMPPQKSLVNALVNDNLYRSQLYKIMDCMDKNHYDVAIKILDTKKRKLIEFWNKIPKNKIPKELVKFLPY